MEHPSSTDDHLKESFPKTSYEKGLVAEDVVVSHFLKKKYHLLHRRRRIAGVEVDLIFQHLAHHELLMVEVKSVTSGFENFRRIHPKQIWRLRRAFMWMIEHSVYPVEFQIVFVDLEKRFLRIMQFGGV